MAIAEHAPSKLNAANRGLLSMAKSKLHDFAATSEKGLPEHVKRKKKGGALQEMAGAAKGK